MLPVAERKFVDGRDKPGHDEAAVAGLTRRQFTRAMLETAATVGLMNVVLGSTALAKPLLRPAERWAAGVVGMARDLKARALSLVQWQDAMEMLNGKVPINELMSYIDFDRVRSVLQMAGSGEQTKRVRLPEIDAGDRHIRTAVFSVPAGEAIPPHGHNNLLSAHLILQGRFRTRTFDRIADEPGHMRLQPRLDAVCGPGSTVSMSDDRDNVHWFVAAKEPVFTLDVVIHAPDLRQYQNPTERERRVYIDPTARPRPDGTIEAAVIDYRTSIARFGRAAE